MKELIVVSLRGSKYGVWKEDVLSVRDVHLIHGLPMTPKWYCGVSEIDGRTANIFDLAVCMGHSPFDRRRPGLVLLMSEKGKPEGFVFEEQTGRLEVSPEEVFPMPAYLYSPEVGTCVVSSRELIPVINIVPLYRRIRQSGWGPTAFSFTAAMQRMKLAPETAFRVFTICGESFAVPKDIAEKEPVSLDAICAFPLAPAHMEGVAFQKGEVRAVLNLADYIELSGDPHYGLVLLQKQGGPALLVDSETGTLGEDAHYRPMPPLAASGLMQYALLREGEVIPLLHVTAMISRNPEKGVKKKYTPRSKFHELFGRKEVKVLEFFLPGMSYSLPDSQVEDVVGLKPYRVLRGVHPMMKGVAEHEGEVVPVLDIAVCFGRSTLGGEDPRMVVLKNGNFRVLLLTEGVAGRRLLSREEQRELPINLPHRYVYGCYTRENTVSLILDVETLTTHFDRRLVSEYFDALAREMALDGILEEAGGDETETREAASAVLEGVRDKAGEEEEEAAQAAASFEGEETGRATHGSFVPGAETAAEDDAFEAAGVSGEGNATGETDETTPVEGDSLKEEAVEEEVEQEDKIGEVEGAVFPGVADADERTGAEEGESAFETPETEDAAGRGDGSPGEEAFGVETEMEDELSGMSGIEGEAAFSGTAGGADLEGAGEGEPGVETIETGEAEAGEGRRPGDETEEEILKDDIGPEREHEGEEGEDEVPSLTGLEDEEDGEERDLAFDATETEETVEVEEEETKEAYSGEDAVTETETEEPAPVFSGPAGEADTDGARSGSGEIGTPFEELESGPQEAFDTGAMVVSRYGTQGDREGNPSEDCVTTTAYSGDSTRTISLEEPESGHEEDGAVPEPPSEYLKASSENEGRRRAAYAAIVLLLLAMAAYLAFGRGGPDTEVALRDEMTAGEGEESVSALADSDSFEDMEEELPPEAFETGVLETEATDAGTLEAEALVTDETFATEAADTETPEPETFMTDMTEAIDIPAVESDALETDKVQEKVASTSPPSTSSEEKTSVLLMELEPKRGEISLSLYKAEPSDPRIYVVVRGDTLWHISRRFTGNPFNYPRLARDSGIENPDLIFPGQRILIRIKGEEGQPLPP